MRVLSIVGARPQFIKVAPICWNSTGKFDHQIVHTGQHYDELMSNSIFADLKIPKPVVNFGVGSGSHAEQTSKIMIELENYLISQRPDHVILYGDTNSTLAGSLVTSKLSIPTSHVEAGLRSHNRSMPEEINRIVTDHLSDLLFAPTKNAMIQLQKEGLYEKSINVGDIMRETIEFAISRIDKQKTKEYIYCTIHRAENTDNKSRLSQIINSLKGSSIKIKLFAHPRLLKKIDDFHINFDKSIIEVMQPLPFLKNIEMLNDAKGVITDSGGLQKEAFLLGTPCLTLRNETEWNETIENSWNQLDFEGNLIKSDWWEKNRGLRAVNAFGDGNTSHKVISKILEFHGY